jgi:hypothetical protein
MMRGRVDRWLVSQLKAKVTGSPTASTSSKRVA